MFPDFGGLHACCAGIGAGQRPGPLRTIASRTSYEERDDMMKLFSDLDVEWSDLARAPQATATVRRWANDDLALRDFDSLYGVVFHAQSCGDPLVSDSILACLARRAPNDDLAARALLQAVLYGLIRIAVDFRTATFSEEEIASVVVTAGYQRIRTYPIERRPGRIAANVLLDTRQTVSRSLCKRRVDEVLASDVGTRDVAEAERSATDELLDLVDEAVRRRRLRLDDARLILLTRVADVPMAEIAAEQGCLPHSLRRRRLRAEAALAAAVA
jgi:hypothetical protein